MENQPEKKMDNGMETGSAWIFPIHLINRGSLFGNVLGTTLNYYKRIPMSTGNGPLATLRP